MDITDILELEPTDGMVNQFIDDQDEVVYIDVYKNHRFAATHNCETDKVTLCGWIEHDVRNPEYFTVEGKNWDQARLIIMDLLADPDYPLDDLEGAVKHYKEQIQ